VAVRVQLLTTQPVEALQLQLVAIYRDAFQLHPYCKEEAEVEGFLRSLPQHMEREGFRIVVAHDDQHGRPVGFAYGYGNTPDQWWHQEVAKAVSPWVVKEWLLESFRLVEMAVTPEVRGRGIGGRLHDQLLRGVPHRKAVLSTMAAETNAYRMYSKRGWRVLLDDHFFPGVARPYRIMGIALTMGHAAQPATGTS
jgi:GNAT superfamily N-acetyltransferase